MNKTDSLRQFISKTGMPRTQAKEALNSTAKLVVSAKYHYPLTRYRTLNPVKVKGRWFKNRLTTQIAGKYKGVVGALLPMFLPLYQTSDPV